MIINQNYESSQLEILSCQAMNTHLNTPCSENKKTVLKLTDAEHRLLRHDQQNWTTSTRGRLDNWMFFCIYAIVPIVSASVILFSLSNVIDAIGQ